MRNKATIYILTEPNGGTIRYVGKTTRDPGLRYEEHFYPGQLRHNNHKNYWLRAHLRHGTKPDMEILAEVDIENADATEIAYIAACRMMGFDLVNATDGGEGGVPSAETRQKQSKARKGKPSTGAARKGILHPHVRGEKNGYAKMTEMEVIEALELYATGDWAIKALGERFDVDAGTIGYIVRRRTWKHIEGYKPYKRELSISGENNPNVKMTEAGVVELRQFYATGMYTLSELGRCFGITDKMAGRIVRRQNWKHI